MEIKSKLPNVGTTIFTVMSALATEHKAVNLGQGFPDFPMSEELTAKVAEAMKNGHNQYAPMPGSNFLKETIAEKVEKLYNITYNPETEITVTAGGTQAIFTALAAIINAGDEVIIPLAITSNSSEKRTANINLERFEGFKLLQGQENLTLELQPNQTLRKLYKFKPEIVDGEIALGDDWSLT